MTRFLAVCTTQDVVPVPPEQRVRPDQQPEPAQHSRRQPVQQGCQEGSVARGEPRPGRAQLSLQDRDLVAQRQDLDVFVPLAHRKEPQ
jgi:hypothetical protein